MWYGSRAWFFTPASMASDAVIYSQDISKLKLATTILGIAPKDQTIMTFFIFPSTGHHVDLAQHFLGEMYKFGNLPKQLWLRSYERGIC